MRELINLDKDNESIYIREITEISQNASVRKAIQEVNKGRITVNVQQLRNSELTHINESFLRFCDLVDYSSGKELVAKDVNLSSLSDIVGETNRHGKLLFIQPTLLTLLSNYVYQAKGQICAE